MRPDPETETRVFARLVRRGVLAEADVRALFEAVAEGRQAGRDVTLSGLALRRGLVSEERLRLWLQTDGEDAPELKGMEYVGKLGEGGTAHVYRVRRRDGSTLAAKVLKPEVAEQPAEVRAFLTEAKLLARLDHPNVVKGVKAGKLGNWYVSLMEDVPGETLLERIQRGGRLAEDDALFVILQTARALEYLRGEGVVHGDIKPGNLMVTEDHSVKVIDLGFASLSSEQEDGEAGDTTRGTAAYLSPEQARGQGDLDVRSDIYSLGATLYQLVLGQLPFEGDDQELVRKAVLDGLSAEATKGSGISRYVHYFIEKMMAKDRALRYQDPASLIADIEDQIEGRKSLDLEPDAEAEESAAELKKRRAERLRRRRKRKR